VVREKKERIGRNPQTGDPIPISARRVLTFKPSQVLKNILNPDKIALRQQSSKSLAAGEE
jgi:integration host factor subunit alpha